MIGRVLNEKRYPSPIPKGGLEILLMVQFKIADEKRKYMELLKEIITQITLQTFQKAMKLRITKNISKP